MEASIHRRAVRVVCSAAGLLSLVLVGSLALPGCGDVPSADEPPPPGAVRGELVQYTATYDDDTTDEQYFIRLNGDERHEQRLFVEAGQVGNIPPGEIVDVWGERMSEGLRVSRMVQVTSPIQTISRKLINDVKQKPRSFAFVLVDIGGGVNLTLEQANQKLFSMAPYMGTAASVRQYFNEASYGRQDVTGQVFGPFPFTMTACNTREMATMLRPMIQGQFDHYLWFLGSRNMSCGWSGLASGGTAARPSKDTWYNASSGCGVLIQEPGHNFGMRHSSAMLCPMGQVFIDDPNMVCTHSEYGDNFDPMGHGGCKHMNSFQKSYVGWLNKCNMAEVTSSGTYTLLPLELPCNGIQSLQIAMPKTRQFFRSGGGGSAGEEPLTHYYLELRAPYGIDKGLQPVVQLRVSGDNKVSTQRPTHTWFLDMNPATKEQEGIPVGGSFSDPAGGIKFTVMSADAKSAQVKIELDGTTPGGPAKCLDDSMLMAPGPGAESCSANVFSIDGTPPPPLPPPSTMPPPGGTPPPTGGTPPPPTGGTPPPPPGAGETPKPPGGAPTPPPTVPPATPMTGPIDAGCGCHLAGAPSGSGAGLALALIGMALLTVRRRRR